jgi:GTP-binding protein
MFIDEAEIYVEGGRGGDGCVSFLREKYRPHGGPDGGSGGQGGDVVLEASPGKSTLADLHRRRHHRAKGGARGGSKNKTGGRGAEMVIVVPVGTVVKGPGGVVLADLAEAGQRYTAARGGRGGRGNAALVSRAGPTPKFAEKGEPGASLSLSLELKLVADVAIVGFPNAGKSSLVARISRARPKVADYPFTTIEPHLGVVVGEDFDYVVTDVPGLVEGAHEGRGMGTAFLRHIERASAVVYLVDMSPDSGRAPASDLVLLEQELGLFNPALTERASLVAANKMDLRPDEELLQELRHECGQRGLDLYPISAVTGVGLPALLGAMGEEVLKAREKGVVTGPAVEYAAPGDDDVMRVRRSGTRFLVEGRRVERLVSMTDWNNDEARAHLALVLRAAGVEDMLAREGAAGGDEVEIAGRVFEYIPEGPAQPQDTDSGSSSPPEGEE